MRTPRPEAGPGIWRFGRRPKPPEEPDRVEDRQLVGGALLTLAGAFIVWSLYRNGVIPFRHWPLELVTPDSWWDGKGRDRAGAVFADLYDLAVLAFIGWIAGRAGQWPEAVRRYVLDAGERRRAAGTISGAFVVWMLVVPSGFIPVVPVFFDLAPDAWLRDPSSEAAVFLFTYGVYTLLTGAIVWGAARLGRWREVFRPQHKDAEEDEAEEPELVAADWAELRAVGLGDVADALEREAASGAMNDVDQARITRAWETVQAQPTRLKPFTDAVRHDGAGAFPHPSGLRDIGARAALHDLVTGQVRIGAAPDDGRNEYAYRGEGIALEPSLVSTGLLVVGPAASGKTGRVVAPCAESLCLLALAGRAAVVSVGSAGSALGADDAYDVVIRIGDPDSRHDLDLYGGTQDPDQAAALLADALLGADPGVRTAELRQASLALAQLLGPYRSAHGRFPGVPELRALLDAEPVAVGSLREACEAAGDGAALRELEGRERQSRRAGDIGPLLADRIAVLDRPAFAGFFEPGWQGRQFSMRALEHPMRVRIDLPERGHAEAARLLTRLLLAQFVSVAPARRDRSLFVGLVLDDAAHTVTAETVRGVQRLRSANAGVVLALRSLDEVAEALRGPLLSAVGCRMALSGVSTWDGRHFADAWGAEWVQTRDVTHTPDVSGGTLRRSLRGVRQLVTGSKVMSQSVTVRQVERERWSASELANTVPAGHAVVSFTSVEGARGAPVLVDLHG
ncbi:hypothetical protein G5C51_13285 [Streptomyces sp. A7024]|uniref:ATP/GTP-binding protein n=1 Tax=Streptomyces coryli TaxID=1128680 RepID=A0A6G4TY10_9ACTN|nr:hypothetical protein [Streptomyces coryli]